VRSNPKSSNSKGDNPKSIKCCLDNLLKKMTIPIILKTSYDNFNKCFPFRSQSMRRVYQSLSLNVLIITVIVGCGGVPTQEMSDARQAIKAARDVEAEHYVPSFWAKVKKDLKQAEQHLEIGQFKLARSVAILAKKQAVQAYNMATAFHHAQKVWQAITIMNYPAPKVSALLEKAQLAAAQGNVEKTIAFAKAAYNHGESALNQALLDRAKIMIDMVKAQQIELSPNELVILELAEVASHQKEGKNAYDLIKRLFNQLP
jgi:hypothetical protein